MTVGAPALRVGSPSSSIRPADGAPGTISLVFFLTGLVVTTLVALAGGLVQALFCLLVTVVFFQLQSWRQFQQRAGVLERLAFVDELTGLGNQRAFWETLRESVAEADSK